MRDQGWRGSIANNGHLRFDGPHKEFVTASSTPSNRGEYGPVLRDLKKAGLSLNGNGSTIKKNRTIRDARSHVLVTPTATEMPSVSTSPISEQYWNAQKVNDYLEARKGEVFEWTQAGYLKVRKTRTETNKPAKLYLNTEVMAFKGSDEYQVLHKPKRAYRRTPAVSPVIEEFAADHAQQDALIEQLRIVVSRRSMDLMTLPELADAIVEAMGPKIEAAVQRAVKSPVKGILGGLLE